MTGQILRRTFEARNHPEGSPERARLNCDVLTSEYMTGQRYLFRKPFLMSDGTPHPTQKFNDKTFTTKRQATAEAECSYCVEYKGDSMMPAHTASAHCESGKRPHCTCDVCY